MFHAFSPQGFSLIHHRSEIHLSIGKNGDPILNAEDFYASLVIGAQAYFGELRRDSGLRALMIARLDDAKDGGPISVGPLA